MTEPRCAAERYPDLPVSARLGASRAATGSPAAGLSSAASISATGRFLPPSPAGRTAGRRIATFCCRARDFEILDTWRSVGLRGTCSNDAKVEDVFVPEHMTTTVESLKGAVPALGVESVCFYVPRYAMFGVFITAVALGAAEAAVEAYIDGARKRVATSSSVGLSSFPTQHVKVSEARAACAPRG